MSKYLIFVALLVVLIGCGGDPQEAISEHFAKGVEHLKSFEFAEATGEFEKIGEIDASDPSPALGQAMILETQRQYIDALGLYLMVSSARPSDADAFAGQYRMFARLESSIEALVAAGALITLRPTDPSARAILARAMIDSKQYSRGREAIRVAVKDGFHPGAADLITSRCFWLGQMPDSAMYYRQKAAISDGQSYDYSLALAEWYESVGMIDSSLTASANAFSLAQSDPFAEDEHFFRALRTGYHATCRGMIDHYAELPKAQAVELMLSFIYHIHIGNRSTSNTIRPALIGAIGETYSSLYFGIFIQRDIIASMSARDDVIAIRGGIKTSNWDEEGIKFIDYLLASRLVGILEEKESVMALEAVKPPHSNDIEVRTGKAWMYKKTGQDEKAATQLKQMIDYHSSQADWLTAAADLVSRHAFRQFSLADSLYRRSLVLDTLYRPAFEGMIAMYNRIGNRSQALKVFRDYPLFADLYPELAVRKALQLAMDDKVDQAMDLFTTNYPLMTGDHESAARFIEQLQQRDEQSQLIRVLEILQQEAGDNTDILILAADLASDLGKYSDGQALAEKALQIEPDLVVAKVERARAIYFLGDKEEALTQLAAIYKSNRANSHNCYWYSRLLAIEERDLDNAMNIARGSVFNAGGDVYVHCNLSFVYYQSGRFDLAAGEARKAGRRHPDHPLPVFRLGLALYMQDDDGAKTELQKAIDLGLTGDELKQAHATLKNL